MYTVTRQNVEQENTVIDVTSQTVYFKRLTSFTINSEQESHAVAGKPRDAAVNSDRYQQPVGQKQSE